MSVYHPSLFCRIVDESVDNYRLSNSSTVIQWLRSVVGPSMAGRNFLSPPFKIICVPQEFQKFGFHMLQNDIRGIAATIRHHSFALSPSKLNTNPGPVGNASNVQILLDTVHSQVRGRKGVPTFFRVLRQF